MNVILSQRFIIVVLNNKKPYYTLSLFQRYSFLKTSASVMPALRHDLNLIGPDLIIFTDGHQKESLKIRAVAKKLMCVSKHIYDFLSPLHKVRHASEMKVLFFVEM